MYGPAIERTECKCGHWTRTDTAHGHNVSQQRLNNGWVLDECVCVRADTTIYCNNRIKEMKMSNDNDNYELEMAFRVQAA